MLIDWVSLRLPLHLIPPETAAVIESVQDRMLRVTASGEVVSISPLWSSIRSDSHQITVCVGADHLRIQGSPARVLGDGCAVFGSGPSSSLDLAGSARAMIAFVGRQFGVDLSSVPLQCWRVTRVDVTQNYFLASLADVKATLSQLSKVNAGRLRVRTIAGDSAYWNPSSNYVSGKAYAKGPHLDYQARRNPHAPKVSEEDRRNAGHILRLEISLKRHFWRERAIAPWYEMDELELSFQHANFFSFLWGTTEVDTIKTLPDIGHDADIMTRCERVAPTPSRGRAAYRTWAAIRASGFDFVRENTPKSTWTRHQRILLDAGLTRADMSLGALAPISRRVDLVPVNSWAELARLAA